MHHGHLGYHSRFFRGSWDDMVARVTKAFGKVPRPERENFAETETEFLQRNVYNNREVERTPVNIRGRYVHTIAFPWEASKELHFVGDDSNKHFQKMNLYVGIDWDSGLADIPPPTLNPQTLYSAVQYSKEAVSIIFKSWLSLSKEPLMKRVYEQIC